MVRKWEGDKSILVRSWEHFLPLIHSNRILMTFVAFKYFVAKVEEGWPWQLFCKSIG